MTLSHNLTVLRYWDFISQLYIFHLITANLFLIFVTLYLTISLLCNFSSCNCDFISPNVTVFNNVSLHLTTEIVFLLIATLYHTL